MRRPRHDFGSNFSHAGEAAIDRRTLFGLAAMLTLGPVQMSEHANAAPVTLLTAPMDVTGTWPGSLPSSALAVVTRMRDVCLKDVRLVSDEQPDAIHIDDHTSGSPA